MNASPSAPKPTIQDILEECPRYRVLVVGKSGVGKSSLIQSAFNVDIKSVSHREAGVCDVNEEIISKQNSHFVLHDSQGFEANEIGNLNKVKTFIESRSGEAIALKEKVHAIWLCVQIPVAGSRVFEIGDEKFVDFVKSETQVPIVVVFTQFDLLVRNMEEGLSDEEMDLPQEEIDQLCLKRANDQFKILCLEPLKKLDSTLEHAKISVKRGHQKTLAHLVGLTQGLIARSNGDLWIVFATSQRASAQSKIKSSIEVGMKQYWQSLAASSNLFGWTLKQCLAILHDDISLSWNFLDPDDLLLNDGFRENIMTCAICHSRVEPLGASIVVVRNLTLCSGYTIKEDPSSQDPEKFQALIGLAVIVVAGAAPAVAVIGLSAAFVKWITGVYQQTPTTLRCLMGYIVGLTLIMERLFLNTLYLPRPFSLTKAHIDQAFDDYKSSEAIQVHRAIRKYSTQTTFQQILKSGNAERKVIELIRQYQQTPASSA